MSHHSHLLFLRGVGMYYSLRIRGQTVPLHIYRTYLSTLSHKRLSKKKKITPVASTTGATGGRGASAGMPSFGAISIASAMVSECFCLGLWKSLRIEGIIL